MHHSLSQITNNRWYRGLDSWWHDALTRYHTLSAHTLSGGWEYLVGGLAIAAALVWLGPTDSWRTVRPLTTWAHEGGHAVATLLLSGHVRSIKLNRDTSGVTGCELPPKRGLFGRVPSGLVSAAGMPSPMIVGAGIALAICYGAPKLAVLSLGALLVLTLPLIRNWWGVRVMAILVALVFALWWAPVWIQAIVLGTMAGVLSLGGLKSISENHRERDERYGTRDAESAAANLHLPVSWVEGMWRIIWVVSVIGVTVFAMRY